MVCLQSEHSDFGKIKIIVQGSKGVIVQRRDLFLDFALPILIDGVVFLFNTNINHKQCPFVQELLKRFCS